MLLKIDSSDSPQTQTTVQPPLLIVPIHAASPTSQASREPLRVNKVPENRAGSESLSKPPEAPATGFSARTQTVPNPIADTSEPQLASRGARLGAVIMDFLVLGLCTVPGTIVISVGRNNEVRLWVGIGILLITFLWLIVTQCIFIARDGQSIGKKVARIRIVNVRDGSNPGFLKAYFLRAFAVGLIGAIPYIGWLFAIIDACFIFRDDRRCIHDLIAETKVVQA